MTMSLLKSVSDQCYICTFHICVLPYIYSYMCSTYVSVCTLLAAYMCIYTFVFFYPPPVASSVIGITVTPGTDAPSNTYDYAIICTIHPESAADMCEVAVRDNQIIVACMYG